MAGGRLGGGARGDELEVNHEINVTPFIDVILVLLIIFMVAAPLSTVDVPVDLPGSSAPAAARPDEPVWLSLQRDLALSLGNAEVARDGLGAALETATRGDRETRIFLRADETVAYGEVMAVMNLLRAAGYLKVALVGLEAGTAVPGRAVPGPAVPGSAQRTAPASGTAPTPSAGPVVTPPASRPAGVAP